MIEPTADAVSRFNVVGWAGEAGFGIDPGVEGSDYCEECDRVRTVRQYGDLLRERGRPVRVRPGDRLAERSAEQAALREAAAFLNRVRKFDPDARWAGWAEKPEVRYGPVDKFTGSTVGWVGFIESSWHQDATGKFVNAEERVLAAAERAEAIAADAELLEARRRLRLMTATVPLLDGLIADSSLLRLYRVIAADVAAHDPTGIAYSESCDG